jgi:hypothetical protein
MKVVEEIKGKKKKEDRTKAWKFTQCLLFVCYLKLKVKEGIG